MPYLGFGKGLVPLDFHKVTWENSPGKTTSDLTQKSMSGTTLSYRTQLLVAGGESRASVNQGSARDGADFLQNRHP